jgi:hypothetical protein
MTQSRDALADLASSAGTEIARLTRIDKVDARDELRFRLWPFLAELAETFQRALGDDRDPATIPVDVVARAVGLLLTMANQLGDFLSKEEMEELARRAAVVTEELMGLCDPDELAAYVEPNRNPVVDNDVFGGEAPGDDDHDAHAREVRDVIDTTIEPAPAPEPASLGEERSNS